MPRLAPWAVLTSTLLAACGGSDSSSPDGGGLSPDGGPVIVLPDAGSDQARDAGDFSPSLRAQHVTTADVGLLAALEAALPGASTQGAKDALVTQFLADVEAQGGTPLVTHDGGTEVAFVQVGPPSTGFSVAGDWNGFASGQLPMAALPSTQLYVAQAALPRAEAYTYKIVDGSNYFDDLRAHNVVWDGIDRFSPGQFNSQVYPELSDPGAGRLVAWRGMNDPTIARQRDVFVYLPRAYDAKNAPPLPTLYFHDGTESLTRLGGDASSHTFSQVADIEYLAHPEQSAVLVFVALPDQSIRLAQYSFPPTTSQPGWPTPQGDQYLSFVRDTLVPRVNSSFSVCPNAVDRGVAGASLGGLISGYFGVRAPGTFGFVGSQSGSYFFNEVVQDAVLNTTPLMPLRWYVDTACPSDNCDPSRELANDLAIAGYPLLHIEQYVDPGTGGGDPAHNWNYWEFRLPELLRDFHSTYGCTP